MRYQVTPICYCSFEWEFDWMTPFGEQVEIVENFLKEIKQKNIRFTKFENYWKQNLVLVRDRVDSYEVRNMWDETMKKQLRISDSKKVSKWKFKYIVLKMEKQYILEKLEKAKYSYEIRKKHFNNFKNKKW